MPFCANKPACNWAVSRCLLRSCCCCIDSSLNLPSASSSIRSHDRSIGCSQVCVCSSSSTTSKGDSEDAADEEEEEEDIFWINERARNVSNDTSSECKEWRTRERRKSTEKQERGSWRDREPLQIGKYENLLSSSETDDRDWEQNGLCDDLCWSENAHVHLWFVSSLFVSWVSLSFTSAFIPFFSQSHLISSHLFNYSFSLSCLLGTAWKKGQTTALGLFLCFLFLISAAFSLLFFPPSAFFSFFLSLSHFPLCLLLSLFVAQLWKQFVVVFVESTQPLNQSTTEKTLLEKLWKVWQQDTTFQESRFSYSLPSVLLSSDSVIVLLCFFTSCFCRQNLLHLMVKIDLNNCHMIPMLTSLPKWDNHLQLHSRISQQPFSIRLFFILPWQLTNKQWSFGEFLKNFMLLDKSNNLASRIAMIQRCWSACGMLLESNLLSCKIDSMLRHDGISLYVLSVVTTT